MGPVTPPESAAVSGGSWFPSENPITSQMKLACSWRMTHVLYWTLTALTPE